MTGGGDRQAILEAAFEHTIRLHRAVLGQDPAPVLMAAAAMRAALARGGKVLACGNGGSASDAQHFAAELVGRFMRERRALPAMALTVDTSILTAVANDYGFEKVFARQVEALAAPADVVLGISTSGRSPNVLEAFAAAHARQATTVALTGGDGGPIGQAADIHVNVPDGATPRVQEVHRTLLHVICELIEEGVDSDKSESPKVRKSESRTIVGRVIDSRTVGLSDCRTARIIECLTPNPLCASRR